MIIIMACDQAATLPAPSETASMLIDFVIPDINYFIYRKCTPVWHLANHILAFYEITYLIKGSARYSLNGKYHEVSAGDILCLPEGIQKGAITYPDRLMHVFSVNFRMKDPNGGNVKFPFPLLSRINIRNDIIKLFHDLNYTWIERQPGYLIKSRGILLLILHRILELTVFDKKETVRDPRIEKVIRYITQHYSERLTVEKLASMVNLNTAYFGTLFNREIGTSVNHYLARIRIRNAENILRSGSCRITDVAEQCGFSDKYYFYKQFKNITGLAPSELLPKKLRKKM
jgi:AraC-like DNA-binding protein